MKKRIIGATLVATAAVAVLASCGNKELPVGDTIVIGCWNDEAKGFVNKYLTDEGKACNGNYKDFDATAKTGLHYTNAAGEKKAIEYIQVTNDGGAYQTKMDEYLAAQNGKKGNKVSETNRIDMFFAEADYIYKYTNSPATADIKGEGYGITDADLAQCYSYTVGAASDDNKVLKGVSFQCCPSGMVYRTDIAKEVLGVETPAEMQEAVSTWAKWEEVAGKMVEKGYLMTGSYADSYRVFSNNADKAWVTDGNKLSIPTAMKDWMAQAERLITSGATLTEGVWDAGKNATFTETGKFVDDKGKEQGNGKVSFCTFGPAWYFNFCMGTAMGEGDEHTNGSYGLWSVIKGPQAHFWGGTWALAAAGSNNKTEVAEILKALVGKDFSLKLLKNEMQYTNNKAANAEWANDEANTGNAFLGGQNDTKVWNDMAGDIKWATPTNYDQLANENIQTCFSKFLKKETATKEAAVEEFYNMMKTTYNALEIVK